MKKKFLSLLSLTLIFLFSGGITAGETPAETVKRLITYQEQHEDLTPLLKESVSLLKSPHYDVRFAALRTLVFAGGPCPEAVPELLKILRRPVPEKNRRLDALHGYALAALVTVCEDEKVFSRLLDSTDPKLVTSVSMALLDSPRLTPALRKKMRWTGSAYGPPLPGQIPDPSFEKGINCWELRKVEGAEGSAVHDLSRARTGKGSLKITKSNSKGFLELRCRDFIKTTPNEHFFWRGFYQAKVTPGSTMLIFGFEDEKGQFIYQGTSLGRSARQSQSFAVNNAPGVWEQRIGLAEKKPISRRLRPVIRLFGDPATIYVDDLALPGASWSSRRAYSIPEICRISPAEAKKRLAARSNATGKVGFYPSGAAGLEIDGKLLPPVIYFSAVFPELGDYKLFYDNKIKVCNFTLHLNDLAGPHTKGSITEISSAPVWQSAGSDKYNFAPLISRLKRLIRQEPEIYVVLGLNITWPADYFKYNPDTLWLDEKGNKAWGNSLHLRGFAPKPHAPGLFPWPSPYADKPFTDAAKVLRAFIRELKKENLHKVVVGCFVAGGHDGQFEIRYRDYSPAGVKAWQKYLTRRYGSDSRLRQAWGDSKVTLAKAQVPSEHWGRYKKGLSPLFFDPKKEAAEIDYERFRQERIWQVKEIMLSAIKKELAKPVLGVAWQMEKFFVKDPTSFLESPVIDVIVTQPVYQNRRGGMPFGNLAPMDSFARKKKLWISELDIRSFLRSIYAEELKHLKVGIPANMAEFRQTVRKLTAEQLSSGTGGWWYLDMFCGAHAHPGMMAEIRRGVELFEKIHNRKDARRRAEVVAVISQDAILNQRQWAASFPMMYQFFALHQSGIPIDVRFARELFSAPDGDKYKVYFFANQFELNDADMAFINKKLKKGNRTLIFNYASGFVDPVRKRLDPERTARLTGFKVKHLPQMATPAVTPRQSPGNLYRAYHDQRDSSPIGKVPRFVINDPQAQIISRYLDDNTPAAGIKKQKGWTSVFLGAPNSLTAAQFHAIARSAGVHCVIAPDKAIVMMNNRFLALTALANGKVTVQLPFTAKVTDCFSGKVLSADQSSFEMTLRSGDGYFFTLEPGKTLLPAPVRKSAVQPQSSPGRQLFKEGDFEGKTTNWRPLINGKVEKSSRFAFHGKSCARMTAVVPGKAASVYCSRFADNYLMGRRLKLEVRLRGEGIARMVVLPYMPGSSKTALLRGERIKLDPAKWQRVSFVYDPGNAVTGRIAPALELESGKELFFDAFRIYDSPDTGVRIQSDTPHTLTAVSKPFTLRYHGAAPGGKGKLYIVDHKQQVRIYASRADKEGKLLFSFPQGMKKAGSYHLVAATGGTNTVTTLEVAEKGELEALQKAASSCRIPSGSRILILGDSLSDFHRGRNYADKLALYLKERKVSVCNAGVKGDMITRVRDRLTGVKTYRPKGYDGIFKKVPDMTCIFLGHNDTVLRDGKIQVPFAEAEKAFRQVLTLLRKHNPSMKIVLMTPVCPLRSVCLANMEKRAKRGLGRIEFGRPELLEEYIRILRKVAKEFDCQVVDLYTPMKRMKEPLHLFNPGDGVHISEAGNRYVALELLKQL